MKDLKLKRILVKTDEDHILMDYEDYTIPQLHDIIKYEDDYELIVTARIISLDYNTITLLVKLFKTKED
jgi:hypothetical protein